MKISNKNTYRHLIDIYNEKQGLQGLIFPFKI